MSTGIKLDWDVMSYPFSIFLAVRGPARFHGASGSSSYFSAGGVRLDSEQASTGERALRIGLMMLDAGNAPHVTAKFRAQHSAEVPGYRSGDRADKATACEPRRRRNPDRHHD